MADTANIAPDIKERTLALGPEGSFIVQSPAGSGKTGLLIQRFLALLPLVERPEEILAITFTRKAAGEMRIRIIDSLIKAKEGHFPENEYERVTLQLALKALIRDSEKGWRLLENPGRLKVQTIDSLSASVTRQMPLLSRLGRQPAISDNPGELYREASRRTVEMLGEAGLDGNAVRQALRRLDNSTSGLEERLSAMLEKRDQWLRHIKRGSEESGLREVLEGGVRNLIEDALTMAALAFPGHLTEDLLGCAGFAASNLAGTDPENAIAALKGLNSMPEASCKDLLLWKGVSELLLTKDGSFRKPKGVTVNIGFPSGKDKESSNRKKEFQDLLESLVPLDALQEGLSRVRRLPLPRYEEEDWATLDAIIRLLPIAEGHLKDVFAERGALDYQAIALSALDALGSEYEPTDIMLAMDIRIKHILVDEYQDTSRTQHELIRALTRGWEEGDGRTLFIVGDPMQSIYLFREAEVGLFLKAKESGIGGIRLTPLVLGCNFRSQGNIVDWVNSAFPNAFPTREDAFMGAVRYARSSAIKEALEKAGTELNIFKANGRERKDLDRAEAQAILEMIRGADRDETIAILAKSRSHLGAVVAALKDAGVDFKSEELDPLGERPVI
ncbi:MAG: UvrD-helicase domain-containing protein, partial [Deltaproteobacteria bacterium]|nr:UvrD-helicase domain-containing protein [Deltaproteobacteria bacterium]